MKNDSRKYKVLENFDYIQFIKDLSENFIHHRQYVNLQNGPKKVEPVGVSVAFFGESSQPSACDEMLRSVQLK